MVNMASMESPALSWSAELSIAPSSAVPESLVGDKILLPQSALEQLLSAVSSSSSAPSPNPHDISWESLAPSRQPQLPDPLTFRLYNPANSRFSHAAPLEFSAKEGQVGLSPLLREALGLEGSGVDGEGRNKIMVVSKNLPKGTYVRLRPLEAGYDEEDWKALLEGYLRGSFTTLTVGEILSVGGRTLAADGRERSEKGEFRFLIDKLEPQEAVCIVDTDLEVDIEPLSEEQARETLKQRLARKSTGGSSGGALKIDENARGTVLPGEYHFYELSKWVHGEPLVIELDEVQGGDEVDVFVSTSNQHHKPRQDEHIWGDFGSRYPKRIEINATNIELVGAKTLVIGVYGYRPIDSSPEDGVQEGDDEGRSPRPYSLQITQSALSAIDISLDDPATAPGPDHKQCKNCKQWVPARTTVLHENFCYRNNVVCSSCGQISKRGTESRHWHCLSCDAHGNNAPHGLSKHTSIFHRPRTCPACNFPPFENLPHLALHRTTTCPAKLTLCQFCHLLVPQSDNPSAASSPPLPSYSTLSPLTPHELNCGGRTTNCHLCTRPVRLRDLPAHLANHTLQRLSTPPPTICANMNCPRTLSSMPSTNPLRMCATCFGPLYAPGYDPTGSILARRLERKLLQQEISGCARRWCRNPTCATGRTNLGTGKDPIPQTVASALPAVKRRIQEGKVALCVDETTQRRRVLAERIANEAAEDGTGGWDLEWTVKAVETANGEEAAAREWLEKYAVRRGER